MEHSSELLRWLARAMVVARERAGLDLVDIAVHARVREGTVERWERGEHLPRNLDPALTAYANACGLVGGPLAMFDLALELWHKHEAADAATRFEDEAARASQQPDERDPSSERDPPGAGAGDAGP